MKQVYKAVFFLLLVAGFGLAGCIMNSGKDKANPGRMSYNTDIRPVLSDKCFLCHGPDEGTREAGLRLDIREHAIAPLEGHTDRYAIVPGDPGQSDMIRRISSDDPAIMMPLPESHLGRLTTEEIDKIKKWISQGAVYEPHWAFIPPVKQDLPSLTNSSLASNEIDYFIFSQLSEMGLKPNREARKEYLLKRVSLDLTGLLPSIELQDQFLNDKSPQAYENIVDQLLDSKNFGEKMAVHWMDVARYADSYGYQDDNIRTQWPYRDWVIHAFNKNYPYDVFLTWQLAGDMLPEAGHEETLATAFLRNHKYTEEGGVIPEEYRIEYVADKVKTYTKGILALTAECAHCHDHKYDPVSQKEYYQMFAFFNNTPEKGYEGDISVSKPAKHPVLTITHADIKNELEFINHKDTSDISVSVMAELSDSSRTTYLLRRGAYDQPAEPVRAEAFESVMRYDTTRFSRDRLGLAQWTVSKENPLTARVFVNQMWQMIFGNAIVKTTGDFGMQGSLPVHPELLDWLAADFMENGWNIKYLIRKIVMSSTYRQSTEASAKKLRADPENLYLSRSPRIRVEAESIRDIVLASSGLLNPETGGASVKPYQPEGLWEAATSGRGALKSYVQDSGEKLYRRGLYTFIKLTAPPPSMIIFDASNRDQCEVIRNKTNTPLQALVMMNDPLVWEASRVLAEDIIGRNSVPGDHITLAFRKIICRMPDKQEHEILMDYYTEQIKYFENNPEDAEKLTKIGEYPLGQPDNIRNSAALTVAIVTIYNLDETITKS
jgi:hypothetical protein